MNHATQLSHVPTVLIVDDDPESLLLVSTMVEYIGYRPVTASSFGEARHLLMQGPAALVLDLVMPEHTSKRLLTFLQETGSAVPVVLMSAALRDQLSSQADEHISRGINVVSILAKPFWVDAMVIALEKAILELPADALAY